MAADLPHGARPQMGEDADKPGAYSLAVRLKQSWADPGGVVEGDLFITGYGIIDKAKLTFYPASDLVDANGCVIRFGMEKLGALWQFGGQEMPFEEHGVTLSLVGGLREPAWQHPSLFFDLQAGRLPVIATETSQARPPVTFALKVRPTARPGIYSLQFGFTYFNGVAWCSAPQQISVTIRNVIQRHETATAALAVLAALVTLAPVVPWVASWVSRGIGLLR